MAQMAFRELDKVTHNNGTKKGRTVILPPMDVFESINLIKLAGIKPRVTMLDPWYNKGFGEIRDDYNDFVISVLEALIGVSDHVFLWGFPEIVAQYFNRIPTEYKLVAWLTWYYKNNPSVIRGWRSSQNTCLHLSQGDAKLYPEHFLNDVQKEKLRQGKLRYMPGPTSVIEAALLVGFVGKNEQTGHPSQKPLKVYEPLFFMTTQEEDIIFDPMCGSGTTGAFALKHNRSAILSDINEEYISIVESRLLEKRIHPNKALHATLISSLSNCIAKPKKDALVVAT